jgi:hypothetical protein
MFSLAPIASAGFVILSSPEKILNDRRRDELRLGAILFT